MGDVLAPNVDNYLKGGATILFQREGTTGYIDLGNIPDFSLSTNAEYLEHTTVRSGVQVIDRREQIKAGFQVKMSTDEFNAANLALMLNAEDPAAFSQSSGTASTATIINPVLGAKYDLGAFRIGSLVVKRETTVTLTSGVDYTAELDAGLFRALPGGAILIADTLDLTFTKPALAGNTVSPLSQSGILRGAIIIDFRASDGQLMIFKHTKASLSYEGDIALSGNEFAKASGTVTIEKDSNASDEYGKWVKLPKAA